jgi:Patatin-like phospholipase
MAEQQNGLTASYYAQESGMPALPGNLKGSVGVCFSGGGSRACTAAMGQMRGLHQLQLLHRDKIKCISSVSGGTWASIIYAFRSPDIDIETFLGGVVSDPGELTWDAHSAENKAAILDYLDFNNLGMVPTRLSPELIIKTMIQLHDQYHYPVSDLWIHAIGKLVLAPFGLAQVDAEGNFLKYMGYTQQ